MVALKKIRFGGGEHMEEKKKKKGNFKDGEGGK